MLIEELQETENTKQNAALAAETPLPTDEFDENPFGHNLGLEDDPEDQTAPLSEAQLAGPPDAVWLSAEDYTESEDEFLK